MPYWFIPLFAAGANAWLCVLVYRHDQRSALNRVFCLSTTTVVSWNLNIFSLYYFQDPERAQYWSTVFRTGTLLMPPTAVHACLVFGDKRSRALQAYLLAAYVLVTFLVFANACGWLVVGVHHHGWGYYPVVYPLYGLHTLSVLANFTVAAALLVAYVRGAPTAQKRMQAKFWLLAASIGIVAGITNLLPMYDIPIYPMGNIGNVAYTAIVAYAIVRYRLLDIDIVVAKGTAYALGALVAIAPVFALAVWMQSRFFGRVDPNFSMALLLSYLLVAGLFPLLRASTERRVGQSLFREKHEYRAALSGFTSTIVRILDREKLLGELAETLMRVLKLDRVAIFLQGPDQAYGLQHSAGIAPTTEEFARGDVLVRSLAQRAETVLREELEAGAAASEQAAIQERYRANGWEVSMPLTISSKLIGFVNLGRKRNLEVFSSGDLELLNTLAAEAAIALENARLYEELKKSQDIIRRADRLSALGTLAAGIAHEVRNPLVSIQTFFQLAPQRLHDQEFFTTFLGMTANEVKRISDLIAELLSFARSSIPSLGAVNINELVERVATLLEPEARKHNLALTRALSANVPLVNADGDQIKQVLINLVLNAIQATRPGGVVAISTRSVDHQNGAFGQLEIRDTGVGIPPDQLEHIFDPFFTTKDKGTGLGLAIAHQIVTEHGGSITVESREGQGTSFCVNLPPYDAASRSAPPEAETEMEAFPLRCTRARKVASS